MNLKRFLAVAITVLMVLAIFPTAAFAEEIGSAAYEAAELRKLDNVWAELEAVEAEALASGASMSEVVMAVYKVAVTLPNVDVDTMGDLSSKGFFFKVDGMCCAYDYVARNVPHQSAINEDLIETIKDVTGKEVNTKNGPTSMNVLVVGPYYNEDLSFPSHYDSSFRRQYIDEGQSIADATGGDLVVLGGHNATGPAIAENFPDAGVVIYDSHGGAMNGTSYLCLTTNSGINSSDYTQGWAYNAGSAAYIDGRYVENYITSELPNTIVWMAICEGMKLSGNGTTGYALLRAGAGCVYGYSQSVSFTGDYIYEATFWNAMKDNATVAEAFNIMTSTHGNWDPAYSSSAGNAWPIVMSPDDPFPSNPDSHQTVNCDWQLFGGSMDPVALESWSLSEEAVSVYRGFTESVTFNRIPNNANQYELVWHSSDESIATVEGNNKRATITGVGVGTTTIYCDVNDLAGVQLGTASCEVEVLYFPTLNEAANVERGHLEFTNPNANYSWQPVIVEGRGAVAKSGNGGVDSSTSTMRLTIDMQAGETLTFDWKVSSESNYDKLGFYVNNAQQGNLISGNVNWTTITYTAATTRTYTFEWRFVKDVSVASGDDCGYVDNVHYSGDPLGVMGDMDGNEVVNMDDALIILRIAMTVITGTDDQIALADLDGDGSVTLNDALIALRMAMGINR